MSIKTDVFCKDCEFMVRWKNFDSVGLAGIDVTPERKCCHPKTQIFDYVNGEEKNNECRNINTDGKCKYFNKVEIKEDNNDGFISKLFTRKK